jgi:hypothetical protein
LTIRAGGLHLDDWTSPATEQSLAVDGALVNTQPASSHASNARVVVLAGTGAAVGAMAIALVANVMYRRHKKDENMPEGQLVINVPLSIL